MRTMLRRDWGGSQPWPLSATMPLQPSGSPASHSLAAQTPQSGPASACRPPASSAAQSEMASSVSIPACTFAGNAGQSAYGYRQRHPAHAELQIPLQLHSQGSSSIDSSSSKHRRSHGPCRSDQNGRPLLPQLQTSTTSLLPEMVPRPAMAQYICCLDCVWIKLQQSLSAYDSVKSIVSR